MSFILDQLSGLDGITHHKMMGEYIIYYRERVLGGIYDNRFMIKPTKTALEMMPESEMDKPYEGAKEMLLVDQVENPDFLTELVLKMYDELPEPKKKKQMSETSLKMRK